MGGGNRQCDVKGSAFVLFGVNPYLAVVAVNHAFDGRKANAYSFGGLFVQLIVRVKDFFLILRRNADAVIRYPVHRMACLNVAAYANLARPIRVEILDGVVQAGL